MSMNNIAPTKSPAVRELFHSLEHHSLISALFENNLKAQVFTDNDSRPQAGLIAYNSRFIFGGDPTQAAFNADLRRHFAETVIPSCNGEPFVTAFTSDAWMPTLNSIFSDYKVILVPRLYFEILPDPTLEITLPEGFSLHHVTPELLASNIGGMDALREEMYSERTSVDDFLARSFGLCPVYENQIAGWCLSEYNTGDRCEIGIATLEPHQRKGIATILTKAFLAEGAQRGYQRVGWDCWETNAASVATARKAGFTLIQREQVMVVIPG
jgi:RimJ/RimL family protein N-acetyltransferase